MTNVILRDNISGQTLEVSEKTAERYLAHPVFGKRLSYARTAKPEVLGNRGEEDLPELPGTQPLEPVDFPTYDLNSSKEK